MFCIDKWEKKEDKNIEDNGVNVVTSETTIIKITFDKFRHLDPLLNSLSKK